MSGFIVWIYYITLMNRKSIKHFLTAQYINFELEIQNKLCSLISLYRPPSQNTSEFERLTSNFEFNLKYI